MEWDDEEDVVLEGSPLHQHLVQEGLAHPASSSQASLSSKASPRPAEEITDAAPGY